MFADIFMIDDHNARCMIIMLSEYDRQMKSEESKEFATFILINLFNNIIYTEYNILNR